MSEDQIVAQISVTLALIITSILGPERFMAAFGALKNIIGWARGYRS